MSRATPTHADFIGRADERAQVLALLGAGRLLTVVGPPGIGKTRLCREVAADAAVGRADGIVWIDLAPVQTAADVLRAVKAALGLPDAAGSRVDEVLRARLRGSDALLILDNCEHVLEPAGAIATRLLTAGPDVDVVVTSRQPLGVAAEVTYRLPPLGVPGPDAMEPARSDAVRLFLSRAHAAGLPEPDGHELEAIARLCRRLEGIPLAIELAAARASHLTVGEIAAGIAPRQDLAGPDGDDRHGSLAAAVAWSYGTLPEADRAGLRALSVLPPSFAADTAAAVAGGRAVLSRLVDASLLTIEGAGRYRLLEAVRLFAAERSVAAERVAAQARAIDHVTRLAAEAEQGLRSAAMVEWVDRLSDEHDSIVAAIGWAIVHGRWADAGGIIARLLWYWLVRGRASQVRDAMEAVLAADDLAPEVCGDFLWAAGRLAQYDWDRATAERHGTAAIAIAREHDRAALLSAGLMGVGWVGLAMRGDRAAARAMFDEATLAAERAGDDMALAFALEGQAAIPMSTGDWPEARRLLDRSVEAARRSGHHEVLLDDLIWLAQLGLYMGDDDAAEAALHEGIDLADRLDDPFHRSSYRSLSASLAARRGEVDRAHGLLAEADTLATQAAAPFPRMLFEVRGALIACWTGAPDATERLERAAATAAKSPVMHIAGALLSAAAELACERGDIEQAETLLARASAWREEAGGADAAIAIAEVAVAVARGDLERAESRAHVAVSDARSVEAVPGLLAALESLAEVLVLRGSRAPAARLLGAVVASRTARGWAEPALSVARRGRIEQGLRTGGDDPADAVAEGARLSLADAVAYAQRGRGKRDRPDAGWGALTPVETDVVRLAARGLSNREIAEGLFISLATVKTHLVHVYAKVGLRTRAQLVAEAVRRGFDPAG